MTRGSDTRRFVYAPDGRALGEYGASTADVKAEFIWAMPEVAAGSGPFGGGDAVMGYAPLAVATPDSGGTIVINWIHPNHLGVPQLTLDASGNPSATPNDYLLPGFPGQARVLADLYYNRYRDYDPTTGRYIQADPIGLGGGSNVFAYAGDDPVNAIDPWGLRKAILFDPVNDAGFYDAARRERDIPGVCLVYGHMSPASVLTWRNGRNVRLTQPHQIFRELIRHGCEPDEPVYFLGCRAGQGDNPIAQRYSRRYGVTTVGSTRYTWWANGYRGTYGRANPTPGQPGYDSMNTKDPGRWRVFPP